MSPGSQESSKKRKVEAISDEFSQLCARCRSIDVERLFNLKAKIGKEGYQVVSLGKPGTKDFLKSCPSCMLLLSVATKYKRQYRLELRLFRPQVNTVLHLRRKDEHLPDPEEMQQFLAVVRQNTRLQHTSVRHEIGPNGLLAISPSSEKPCTVHMVEPSAIKYDLLKSWIRECETNHHESCGSVHDLGAFMKLQAIDCQTGTLVALAPGDKYAALSYVWGYTGDGNHLVTDKERPHTRIDLASADLPLTIKDSIQAVKGLGLRYLWVDRYCIPQADKSQRHDAISNMNKIYAGAEVTLVALFGHDSRAGLPGVSSVPRDEVQTVSTPSGKMISTFPRLATVISNSTWATRGWTYQEARLSRRCLFFSEYQVYFACNSMVMSEALSKLPSVSLIAQYLNEGDLGPVSFTAPSKRFLSGFSLDRMNYTQRTLSYQKDALDAFRGLLRQYPFVTLWGIPVSILEKEHDPCVGFAFGSLWRRRPFDSFDSHVTGESMSSYTRRPGFPTWSWASVDGDIYQDSGPIFSHCSQFIDMPTENLSKNDEPCKPCFEMRLSKSGPTLAEAIAMANTNIVLETSMSVFIRGDLVKVKGAGSAGTAVAYGFCDEEGELIQGRRITATFDVDADYESSSNKSSEPEDAWILTEWSDGLGRTEMRFVLMLLRWRPDGAAERKGILGKYADSWDTVFVESLPRRRTEFELQ